MPADGQAIWDLAIAENNQQLLAGTEYTAGRRETTLVFVGVRSLTFQLLAGTEYTAGRRETTLVFVGTTVGMCSSTY